MDYKDKTKGYYDNLRKEMLKYLPKEAKKVLDVGCGNGCFAEVIKKQNTAEVWGIELMEQEANLAKQVIDKVFAGPCENFIDNLPDDYFDAIYFNDVLEHLVNPYLVLSKIKNKLSTNGVIISSIPNVRYHNSFIKVLINKDWKYEPYGVMDFTHLRFFTEKSIIRMYSDAGYKVEISEGINKSRSLKPYLYNILFLFTQLDIRYPQFATVAKVKK
jgi:2-polyprenyl-3-methyl-5-hydroxy-6-metoxy-1,4-benzoquinol methylase